MNGIVLGKFLPFHKGHESLIDFALLNTSIDEKLYIIICSLKSDIIPLHTRWRAIHETYSHDERVIFLTESRELPQFPEDDSNFWSIWKEVITSKIELNDNFCLYTSDAYGVEYAKVLGIKYFPFNPDRDFIPISGTNVRNHMIDNFSYLNKNMKKYLRKEFALVGPESTGKTTLTNALKKGNETIIDITPEYARNYLNLLGSELNEDKMNDIYVGQSNLEKVSRNNSDKPYLVRDTNILTTYGYAVLYGYKRLEKAIDLALDFNMDQIDKYFVLVDNIPFEKDPLRYGGDERETDVDFWIDILKKFSKNYVVIDSQNIYRRRNQIFHGILTHV